MCGFVGILHFDRARRADERLLARMSDQIAYRGPDDAGLWTDGSIGFGHRRLAIVDLTPTGHQPMFSGDRRHVIAYNGEMYNHAELRPALEQRGVRFRGTSDTETIVEAFAADGAASFQKLIGIFAFAIWDAGERALYLVRDPLGVKQVYYWTDGASLVFGSEIKPLLLFPGVERTPDLEAVAEYLHFHTTVGARTFFHGIRVLEPGHYLKVADGGIEVRRYAAPDDYTPLGISDAETSARVQQTVRDVVGSQLMSDVPVGCFLSGGVDSTVVARYARELSHQTVRDAFGCYFEEDGAFSEEPYGRRAAETLDLELHVTHPTAGDFADTFARALWHQDEPKIGAAMIGMWKVAELAARSVKVCLGGQAADEVFGGYARYALAAPARTLFREIVKRARRGGRAVGANVQKQATHGNNASRLARSLNPLQGWEQRYFENLAQIPAATIARMMPGAPRLADRAAELEKFRRTVRRCESRDPMDRAMFWDRTVYLPGLFVQDDRMSMAHSLETRVPLADPRLVRLALRIPSRLKMNGLTNKWVLKQALVGVMPRWVIDRQKIGFQSPTQAWYRRAGEMIRDLLAGERTRARGLFDTSQTAALMERGATLATDDVLIWKLINIEQWMRLFVDAAPVRASLEIEAVPQLLRSGG